MPIEIETEKNSIKSYVITENKAQGGTQLAF